MKKRLVVAFGGNALIHHPEQTDFEHQYHCLAQTVSHIVDLIVAGWQILIVHGNGPQVGFSLRRSELAKNEVSPLSLDYAVAESQGSIGFMFQRAIYNELKKKQLAYPVVTLVTQTLVDGQDAAFLAPSKPVGGFMSKEQAQQMQQELGWAVMEDAGRGFRRCVASPKPKAVLELPLIERLLETGTTVIAAGGGGIAVTANSDGTLSGVEAVIDKDFTAALLAVALEAKFLLIPTGVSKVALNFGQPNQIWLEQLRVEEAQSLVVSGQFGRGSMQPKIEALLDYVSNYPQGCGVITDPTSMLAALRGENGTRIEGCAFQS